MGAMCVSKEERQKEIQRVNLQRQRQRAQKYELQNCQYAKKVRKYTQLYGKPITEQTKEFIKNCYNFDYSSQTHPPGYPTYGTLTLTYKSSLIDRFETANKNGNYTQKLEFVKLDKSRNFISYRWQIKASGKTKCYDVDTYFDDQDKFKKALFREQARYQPIKYYPQQTKPKSNYYQENSNQNNYYQKPIDWGAHYAAQVQRSNAQFRQNMNRQAQEWNNYARQHNNRGY